MARRSLIGRPPARVAPGVRTTVSERGTLGEFNLGQALVCRTMRPVLESLAVEFHTITRRDELEFIVDRSIKQAVATQAAVAFVLSPLLTGGKVSEA
jgi:sulfopyruvate decarboxylase TPP-binding subunit